MGKRRFQRAKEPSGTGTVAEASSPSNSQTTTTRRRRGRPRKNLENPEDFKKEESEDDEDYEDEEEEGDEEVEIMKREKQKKKVLRSSLGSSVEEGQKLKHEELEEEEEEEKKTEMTVKVVPPSSSRRSRRKSTPVKSWCPIPDGYDPCQVGPRIDKVLMSLGYSGPLRITAYCYLEDIPDEVMRALSSTGILLREVARGLNSVLEDMLEWEGNNQPPAAVMLISDYIGVDAFTYPLYLEKKGYYNILLAYPYPLIRRPPGLFTSAEWLWKPLLTNAMDSENKHETRRPEKKCSKDAFRCQSCICDFASDSFEMFIDHLMSKQHAVKRWSRKIVKPNKDTYKVFEARDEPSLPMYAATPPKEESLEEDKDRVCISIEEDVNTNCRCPMLCSRMVC